MKLEQYIDKLEKNDDIECGMLADLEENEPSMLHSNIMEAIYRNRGTRLQLIKRHCSAFAAVIIFVIIISMISGIFSGKYKKQSTGAVNSAADIEKKNEEIVLNENSDFSKQAQPKDSKEKRGLSGNALNFGGDYAFEIDINNSNKKALDFIKSRGILLESNLYKIKVSDFEILKKMLDEKNIIPDVNYAAISKERLKSIEEEGVYKVIKINIK
ncbi:hypothetical protein [Fonticella tunisiensis]|uniref:Uncharacterized protein n=1 Tax=Fonticella tunisiensis TaxID=1096341 RepID=A0A4R7KR28_9CLOT|nr:hypothetical protein [Fonticella tunisiensis]TDT61186.1 hypothetical protein EDD71_10887 [Fonticella tunisiensis]